jgi:excisionase family DNA binding protein
MPPFLTINQVAERLNVTPYTARAIVASGRIKGTKFGDSPKAHWRIKPADLEAFIKAKEARQQTGRR